MCSLQKNLLAEARDHLFLAIVFEGQEKRAGIMSELGKAVRCLDTESSPPWIWVRVGIGYARAGDTQRAAQMLQTARKRTDPESPEQSSDLAWLEGELELARGHHRRAVELLALADNAYHRSFTVESLARAYRILADTENAISAYEQLLAMKYRSLGFEPQQNWISAHYWLAAIYLSRCDTIKAGKLVNALLELLNQADSDLPLLQKATRLASEVDRVGLSGQTHCR